MNKLNIVLFLWVALGTMFIVPELREAFYISSYITILSLLVCFRFPGIVQSLHSKPVYYEDLEDKFSLDSTVRNRYQRIFTIIQTIFLAISLGIVADFVIYKSHEVNNYIELLGIIGGLLSILNDIMVQFGKFILGMLEGKAKNHLPLVTSSSSFDINPINQVEFNYLSSEER